MRTLSTTELAMQDQVKADQREGFKITNTSLLVHHYDNYRDVTGKLIPLPVYSIRYGGSFNGKNVWGL